ncbi:3946_t:CDS:2 [Ambispora gerdemannii]|uniref:3946_t:CDS:1 n=1 Tax=Ambispora gerdemannii TaxID=144530 RepID=A0A9N9GJD3_9GLOM|nr:3946_t:CDS:2 [Ambispora gerdemannii]
MSSGSGRNDINSNHPPLLTISQAKERGMTDAIGDIFVQEQVKEIVKEHKDGVILSEIPKLYFEKYGRALVYQGQGKLSVALPGNVREIKLQLRGKNHFAFYTPDQHNHHNEETRYALNRNTSSNYPGDEFISEVNRVPLLKPRYFRSEQISDPDITTTTGINRKRNRGTIFHYHKKQERDESMMMYHRLDSRLERENADVKGIKYRRGIWNKQDMEMNSQPESLNGEYEIDIRHQNKKVLRSSNSESEIEPYIKMEFYQAGENLPSNNGHLRLVTDHELSFQEANGGCQPFDNSSSFMPMGCGFFYPSMPIAPTVQVLDDSSEWSPEELQEVLLQLLFSD